MYDVKRIAGEWRVRSLSVCFGPMVISETFGSQAKAWRFVRNEMSCMELTLAELREEIKKWKVNVNWQEEYWIAKASQHA